MPCICRHKQPSASCDRSRLWTVVMLWLLKATCMSCGLMWMSVCWRNLNSAGEGSHVWQAVIGVSCFLYFPFREYSLYSTYTSGWWHFTFSFNIIMSLLLISALNRLHTQHPHGSCPFVAVCVMSWPKIKVMNDSARILQVT